MRHEIILNIGSDTPVFMANNGNWIHSSKQRRIPFFKSGFADLRVCPLMDMWVCW